MAEEAKNSAAAHAAEIEALKRQIEEMNKRLEELSAATNAGAPARAILLLWLLRLRLPRLPRSSNPRFHPRRPLSIRV